MGLTARGGHLFLDVTNKPMPTIQLRPVKMIVTNNNENSEPNSNKPAYKVPSMQQINQLKWNGFNVISTFSGAGGSCLGYRMAGYRVLWANEFVPAAQQVYKLNHPDSILDTRDIRLIQPSDILNSTGLLKGELDLLDGSPPCASFSTAGNREKSWGQVKKYSDTKQRTDDLFFEYARLLEGLQPKVFAAENVSGLIKGKAKGYFKVILKMLKKCGYIVKARVLDAQWLGVPQMRQRLIFIGVRSDLGLQPVYPKPLGYRYSVIDAIGQFIKTKSYSSNNFISSSLPAATIQASGQYFTEIESETDIAKYAIGDEWDKIEQGNASKKYFSLKKPDLNKPCQCITQTGGNTGAASVTHPTEKRKFSIAELKRIMAFPDDFELTGSYAQQWERLGRAVPPVMMSKIASEIDKGILSKIRGV
ncbi:MAG: DNA cytosine methyltransferase [Colwellia sp.]|nr:DNA cytosine methyltransferase [Colwellia sp.]